MNLNENGLAMSDKNQRNISSLNLVLENCTRGKSVKGKAGTPAAALCTLDRHFLSVLGFRYEVSGRNVKRNPKAEAQILIKGSKQGLLGLQSQGDMAKSRAFFASAML